MATHAHSASVPARSSVPDTGEQSRQTPAGRKDDRWTPHNTLKVIVAMLTLIATFLAAVAWSSDVAVKYDRITHAWVAMENRIGSLEGRFAKIVEDGVLPVSIEHRLASIERSISRIEAAVRSTPVGGYPLNKPLSLIPKD